MTAWALAASLPDRHDLRALCRRAQPFAGRIRDRGDVDVATRLLVDVLRRLRPDSLRP